MEFTFLRSGNFYVHELVLDADGAKVSGANVDLRIYEVVPGGNWKVYDWDDDTFKTTNPTTLSDTCTEQTMGGGAVEPSVYENDTAIDYTKFNAGTRYLFEFYDTDNSLVVATSESQYAGQYGDIAQASAVATEANVNSKHTTTDNNVDSKHSTTDGNISNVNSTVQNISNVTRLSTSLVTYMERGAANRAVKVQVALKDMNGDMEDPDSNVIALKVENASGTSRAANLYKDVAFANALDDGSGTFTGWKELERVSEGVYEFFYKVEPAATEEELIFKYGWEEAGITLLEFGRSQVTDSANDLLAIKAKTDLMSFTGNDIKATLDSEKVQVSGIDTDAISAAAMSAAAVTKIQNTLAKTTDVTTAHSATDILINAIVPAIFAKAIDNTRTFEQITKLLNAVFRGSWSYDSGTSILTLTYEDGTTLQWNFSTTNKRTTV